MNICIEISLPILDDFDENEDMRSLGRWILLA